MATGTRTPGPLAIEIAGILRAELARKQLRQTDLVAPTGISEGQLSKMFGGKKAFDIEDLDKLALAMGLDLMTQIIKPADAATQHRHL